MPTPKSRAKRGGKPTRRKLGRAAAAAAQPAGATVRDVVDMATAGHLVRSEGEPSPTWLIEEAVATVTIAVGHHHPSLSRQGRETVARTAVTAALTCIPALQRMDGPRPLVAEQTDPRAAGGDVAVAETYAEAGAVVDPTRAVLVETAQAVLIDASTAVAGAELLTRSVGLLLGGTINGTAEQARILYIMPIEGAAEVVAEVFKLGMRSGPLINVQLSQAINRLIAPAQEGTTS